MQKSSSADGGSFTTGFVTGIAVSALGYYFFATPKGKRQRETLSIKWAQAQAEFSKRNKTEGRAKSSPAKSLKETVSMIVDEIDKAIKKEKKSSGHVDTKAKRGRRRPRQNKPTTFRGVK